MKASLVIYFDYDNKDDDQKDGKISKLLMNFGEFCECSEFQFQVIPRVGENIHAYSLLKKWTNDIGYEKGCSDIEAYNTINKVLRTGFFVVEKVFHDLDSCTVHCSDIEYPE